MNRFLVVCVLLLFFNLSDVFGQGIWLGAKGGVNMSSLNIEKSKYKVGYQIGGFARLMITNRVGIQTEALYSLQNSIVSDQSIELNYLSVPVLLYFNLNQFISVQIGPQYSMLVDSSGEVESFESNIKNKNICLAVGVGVEMPMGFSASLRFVNALNSDYDGVGDVSSDMVQLSMGIALLELKK